MEKDDWVVVGASVGFALPLIIFVAVASFVYFSSEPTVIAAAPTTATSAPQTTAPTGTTAPATTVPPGAGIDGAEVAATAACIACHSTDGSVLVGPSWQGLFGTERAFADGTTGVVDEAYLTESIVDPAAKIVADFQDLMPKDFGARLTGDEIAALVEYIKSLA